VTFAHIKASTFVMNRGTDDKPVQMETAASTCLDLLLLKETLRNMLYGGDPYGATVRAPQLNINQRPVVQDGLVP
jgi:hypothetical protein